ncbi:hypothetical protein [Paenibacillus silviterrae]|nr:hypothetical protein [Paenibacillus chinjuensis]
MNMNEASHIQENEILATLPATLGKCYSSRSGRKAKRSFTRHVSPS